MEFHWPHMAATAVIILIVLTLLRKTKVIEGSSKGKRFLVTAAALFVPIFILNLSWPYS